MSLNELESGGRPEAQTFGHRLEAASDLTCTMIHNLTMLHLDQGDAAVRDSAAAMITAGLAHLQALDGFDGARRVLVRELKALRRRRTVQTVGRPGR